ncbi:MAG: hypothetical protein JNN30_08390 [Rhodanobacteraceae bacterium]|nr:hypothetical protein [Rhodanobacteraceae bacterium]
MKALYFHEPEPTYYKLCRFVGLFPFLHSSFFFVYTRALTEARALTASDAVHLGGSPPRCSFGLMYFRKTRPLSKHNSPQADVWNQVCGLICSCWATLSRL